MRILMLSHGYLNTISGVAQVVQKLARAMVERGHAVMVVSGHQNGAGITTGQDQGVMIHWAHSLPNPFWKDGPIPFVGRNDLRQLIASFQPDLIHAHENLLLSWGVLFLRTELQIPLLASCYYFPSFYQHYLPYGQKLDPIIQTFAWNYAIPELNRFDHTIFSTTTQAQAFKEHGLSTPYSVISNGVDMHLYHPANGGDAVIDQVIEARFQLPSHPRLLYNGRLAKDKRIDLLIKAMPRLVETCAAHLLLTGRGDDRARLENLAHQLGVEAHVHFLGFVSDADLPAIFRLSDLFVIGSICEVQSIPTLKALASGLPVVAARAGALVELVQEGQNGYLVTPGDARALAEGVERVLAEPQKRLLFQEIGRALSQAHDERLTFNRFEQLYSELFLLKKEFNHQPRQKHRQGN
jgi:1,2-diacylglycerol 3-alpha-glucosyltransferase